MVEHLERLAPGKMGPSLRVSETEDLADLLSPALANWQDAAGPFWPYVCSTPFIAQAGLVETSPAASSAHRSSAIPRDIDELLDHPASGRSLIVADVVAERALASVPALNARGYVVIPIIQRWTAAEAVISSRRLVAQLVAVGQRVTLPAEPKGVMLLLDRRRFGRHPDPSVGKPSPAGPLRRFDNRYEYPICRFPPAEVLRRSGVCVVRWTPAAAAPDVLPYLERLDLERLGVEGLALSSNVVHGSDGSASNAWDEQTEAGAGKTARPTAARLAPSVST